MRLASCVAIELGALVVIGAAAATGLLVGAGQWRVSEAQAAVGIATVSIPTAMRGRVVAWETPARWTGPLATGTFHGMLDRDLIAPLRTGKIASVKFNRGGSSISLRIEFDNGARAAFKPEQTNYQTIPRKEVAAYRVSRLLGLSSVQPAIGRAFDADELLAALEPGSLQFANRLRTEMIRTDGKVRGELSYWIPIIRDAQVSGFDIDKVEGMVTWKRLLQIGAEVPDGDRAIVAQLSNLLVFDFLINNPDRWSGGNAKVSEDGSTLYFMDNTMSFSPHPKAGRKVRLYFQRAQTFSRALVERLRGLDEDQVEAALAIDAAPFDPLLTADELEAMFARRDLALAYIDELIAAHGEDKVLVFP